MRNRAIQDKQRRIYGARIRLDWFMEAKRQKEPPLALPEKWLIKHNIGFRHIPPSSPHLNGHIERPHVVDKWRYP